MNDQNTIFGIYKFIKNVLYHAGFPIDEFSVASEFCFFTIMFLLFCFIQNPSLYSKYKDRFNPTILEVLQQFPSVKCNVTMLIRILPVLKPVSGSFLFTKQTQVCKFIKSQLHHGYFLSNFLKFLELLFKEQLKTASSNNKESRAMYQI